MPPPRLRNQNLRNESTTNDKAGTLDVPLKFLDQDYQELQKICFANKKRFVDDKFPPDSSSIDPQKKLKLDLDQIKWFRPSVSYPVLTFDLQTFSNFKKDLKKTYPVANNLQLSVAKCLLGRVRTGSLLRQNISSVMKADPKCII